jgi:hypothetical protein
LVATFDTGDRRAAALGDILTQTMKTKIKTNTEAPGTPKIPDLQRQVTELKERLAIAKKRVISTKESHKRAKKTFKLAKRDAKGVRKKLKVLNRALDEATVAAIAPRIVARKKLRKAVKKSTRPLKPKAAGRRTVSAAKAPYSSKAAGAVSDAQEIEPAPGLNPSGARRAV